jgi:MoxR-like ATPase
MTNAETWDLLFDEREVKRERPSDLPPYIMSDTTRLAVNVALATERPLLLRGDPGSGKSTLARYVAFCKDWDYEAGVITSRTEARDLLYRFDAVRRLSDYSLPRKEGSKPPGNETYIEPGVLWRAMHPERAKDFGEKASNPQPTASEIKQGVVVLLDEIDKADPDVPNDLLVVLESRWFALPELGKDEVIRSPRTRPMLVMITSNGERDLPSAFLRRCIACDLPRHQPGELRTIAEKHFPGVTKEVLDAVEAGAKRASDEVQGDQLPPSTAEYLDAVRALREVDKKFGTPAQIVRSALWKHGPLAPDDNG